MKKYNEIFTDPRITREKRLKIMSTYGGMKERVSNKNGEHPTYEGIPLCEAEEFYKWAQQDDAFHEIYDHWESNGESRKLTASIDKDSRETGYMLGYMKWLPLSQHFSKDGIGKKLSDKTKRRMSEAHTEINSIRQVAKRMGVSPYSVWNWKKKGILEKKIIEMGLNINEIIK